MRSRTRRRSPLLRHRLASRCAPVAVPVLLAAGGALVFTASPASAASSSTDSLYVEDYPTSLVEPLPAGTPDVATPLTTALTDVCQLPVPSSQLAQLTAGEVLVCFVPEVGPNEIIVAGTENVGILMPDGGTTLYCGVALYVFPVSGGNTATVGIEPPPGTCQY